VVLQQLKSFQDIHDLIQEEFEQNNAYIVDQLSSDVALINQINQYIIHSGGKRLRPLLVLLLAKALNYQGEKHIPVASIIEFIHTATLLHDDVVDESSLRRGQPTANHQFGNPASVLTGDFLYSRAFQIMVKLDSMPIMQILADATNQIAQGEVLQLLNAHNADITENAYFNVIYRKTAKLFEAACEIMGILAQLNDEQLTHLKKYGCHLGNAFQIADDVMDYACDAQTMGKNIGDDLKEGKVTLPLIYALQMTQQPHSQKALIRAIQTSETDDILSLVTIIQNSGAIEHTQAKALAEAQSAQYHLNFLGEPSVYKNALETLPKLAINRLS
jgi:octaprenyl-diphosphate synthase